MRQKLTILIILSLLALVGCSNSGTDKSKELELKEKELALKEKELELKQKSPTESNSNKAETTEKTESVKTVGTPPEKTSSEREQIMDALRVPVEKELKQGIKFKVFDLNILDDWAYMGGEPLSKSGGKPNYKGTKYDDPADPDDLENMENRIDALLQKKGGKWTVVKYNLGCTDVCYALWWKEFGAPKKIFPHTEE